jgi:OmpA-OmpF porin, OOP family
MVNIKSCLFIFLLLLAIVYHGYCQKSTLHTKSSKAVKLYHESSNLMAKRDFPKAVETLQKAVKVDDDFAEAHYGLGFIYMMDNKAVEAKPHLEKAIAVMGEDNGIKDAFFYLSEIYFNEEKYAEAKEMADKYLKMKPGSRGNGFKAHQISMSSEFAIEAIKKPLDFKPKPMADVLNQFKRQYFPVLTADQQTIIFTVNEGNREDENIYISTKLNGEWQRPQSISKTLNTDFNEGTCSISADGRIMIFTACDGRETYGRCDLYETHKIGEEWTEPVNLGQGVNSPMWESQPSLSADGRTLYFISDRRSGYGGRDIYVSKKDNKGNWMPATNVGNSINTPFDEVSPFIHSNGKTLFFSSEGLPGMGGFDLYFSEQQGNLWTAPKNLGYPLNTKDDQVSLFVSADGKKAYYTFENVDANRQYRSVLAEFDMPPEIAPAFKSNYVKGEVFDAETHNKLQASIDLYNVKTEELVSSVSSDKVTGEYMIVLTEGSEYALYARREGYLFRSLSFDYSENKNPDPVVVNIALEKVKPGAKVVLNNIFFATGKYDLEDKSKTELDKIIEFMENNPKLKVEISGHTDDVGSDVDNMKLSVNRAKAVYDFLITAGVAKERLMSKGYGETQPSVPNDSEANRQINRRIEFKVL